MNFIQKIVGFFNPPKKINVVKCITEQWTIPSRFLDRLVQVRVWMPPRYAKDKDIRYPVLFFNDGQDMAAVGVPEVLENGFADQSITPFILIAVSASDNRIREYGTACQPDYKGRGDLAKNYNSFVIRELVPLVRNRYRCKVETSATIFAGFSLSGLSAFDLVWGNPKIFGKVGVFSGSFWWRSRPYQNDEADFQDRMAHATILYTGKRDTLSFWLQTGTKDETEDRNHNGVIDAIDDTLDIIKCLRHVGYSDNVIQYEQIQDGEHNQQTWGRVLPNFLRWAFG